MPENYELKIREVLSEASEKLRNIIGGRVVINWSKHTSDNNIEDLKTLITEECNVEWQQIIRRGRQSDIVVARHLFCWFGNKIYGYTKVSLGNMLNMDHSSIILAIRRIDDLLCVKDAKVYSIHQLICKRLNIPANA